MSRIMPPGGRYYQFGDSQLFPEQLPGQWGYPASVLKADSLVIHEPASLRVFKTLEEFGLHAAGHIVKAVKDNPDALILLPTGDTPRPVYAALVSIFQADRSLDLSRVRLMNLDEYVGLPAMHPLGYAYYMRRVLLDRLREIDPVRAPKDWFIPKSDCPDPSVEAVEYAAKLASNIRETGRGKADLVVLGVGGAYPIQDAKGAFTGEVAGGPIGFNEPGSGIDSMTRVVALTPKMRLDTQWRFHDFDLWVRRYLAGDSNAYFMDGILPQNPALKQGILDSRGFRPQKAITVGIKEILNSSEILFLATGESKSPVVKKALQDPPNPMFPATYVRHHPNVHYILDDDAARGLGRGIASKSAEPAAKLEVMRAAVLDALDANPRTAIEDIRISQLKQYISKKEIDQMGGVDRVIYDAKTFLKKSIHGPGNDLLPRKGERVVVLSPHPDDDVITMGATIKMLLERGVDVTVVYLTSGENAVRDDYTGTIRLHDKLAKANASSKTPLTGEELWEQARTNLRVDEAKNAGAKLGVKAEKQRYLNLPYYYKRTFVDKDPLKDGEDVKILKELLDELQPDHIYYSAEPDPHGAHGLGAKTLKQAIIDSKAAKARLWGYRGAWDEWRLERNPENLVIVPFNHGQWEVKKQAIRQHHSQIEKPMYPGTDPRTFDQRAHDRNIGTGTTLWRLGYLEKPAYAEVFQVEK